MIMQLSLKIKQVKKKNLKCYAHWKETFTLKILYKCISVRHTKLTLYSSVQFYTVVSKTCKTVD
jgi:hypothetical protein